jgi:hypothetical protein
MKRIVTIVAAAALLVSSSAFADFYGWSLSGSAAAPCVSTGPAASITNLALWLNYTTDDGMSAMEADLVLAGGVTNFGFNTLNGFLNAGTASHLLLAVGGCPAGPVLAGTWTIFDPASLGFGACLVGANVTVDCDVVNPVAWPHGVTGYSSVPGGVPCQVEVSSGTGCTPPIVAVESSSWGSVKSLYR